MGDQRERSRSRSPPALAGTPLQARSVVLWQPAALSGSSGVEVSLSSSSESSVLDSSESCFTLSALPVDDSGVATLALDGHESDVGWDDDVVAIATSSATAPVLDGSDSDLYDIVQPNTTFAFDASGPSPSDYALSNPDNELDEISDDTYSTPSDDALSGATTQPWEWQSSDDELAGGSGSGEAPPGGPALPTGPAGPAPTAASSGTASGTASDTASGTASGTAGAGSSMPSVFFSGPVTFNGPVMFVCAVNVSSAHSGGMSAASSSAQRIDQSPPL